MKMIATTEARTPAAESRYLQFSRLPVLLRSIQGRSSRLQVIREIKLIVFNQTSPSSCLSYVHDRMPSLTFRGNPPPIGKQIDSRCDLLAISRPAERPGKLVRVLSRYTVV